MNGSGRRRKRTGLWLATLALFLVVPLPMAAHGSPGADSAAPSPGSYCRSIAGPSGSFYDENVTHTSRVASAPWPTASPGAEGVDSSRLDSAAATLGRRPELRSFLVIRHGVLIAEHYFHGAAQQSSSNVHSASKTMLSAAVGVAISQGKIK